MLFLLLFPWLLKKKIILNMEKNRRSFLLKKNPLLFGLMITTQGAWEEEGAGVKRVKMAR